MRRRLIEKYSQKGMETALDKKTVVESRRKKKLKKETVAKKREARQQLSPPFPLAAAPLRYPLSPPFFVLPCADMEAMRLPRPVSCCRGVHVTASSAR